jgi:hypothetical protein
VSVFNYDSLKALAARLGRPVSTLVAETFQRDPFYVYPGRQQWAEWIATTLSRLEVPDRYHYRRIHYLIVSQDEANRVFLPDGEPYQNTDKCSAALNRALLDAVHLRLLPPEAVLDHRNAEPIIYLVGEQEGSIDVLNSGLSNVDVRMPAPSRLYFERPVVAQPFHLEVWVEKTTMNDVLLPLARRFDFNLITGVGELSATQCRKLVDRAAKSGRPVRILYVSDFDPAGAAMPVSVARKIEFELYERELDLDVQLRPIILTHDQCVEYRLPRTPIKDGEPRRGGFEKRFGEGATELDALEAVHPGVLAQIIRAEIDRYYDHDHDSNVDDRCSQIAEIFWNITTDVYSAHRPELDKLTAEFGKITEAYKAWLEQAQPLWKTIADELEENSPDLDGEEWTSPFVADEDPNPLFDSKRSYVEQIDRYKAHQDKPTERAAFKLLCTCVICGAQFPGKKSSKVCGAEKCRKAASSRRTAAWAREKRRRDRAQAVGRT